MTRFTPAHGTCAALLLACPVLAAAEDPRPSEEIVVVGDGSQVELLEPFAGGQVARGGRAGLLGNLDMMDVPFVGTAFTQTLIRNQQARSVGDVLQNDPVVRVAKGFGNFQELYIIRGFPVFSDDMTYNGVYGILPRQYVAAELFERVEVFRGANSFLNGAAPGGSGVGGAFNMVPKRADSEPLTRFTVGYENDGQAYGALDVGRRFGSADEFGVRMNLVGRQGEIAIDDQKRELRVISLGTDYQSKRLRLSADLGYQDQHLDNPRPQVTPVGGVPLAPDAAGNFAQPWTFSDERQLFGAIRAEFDITDFASAWAAFGGRRGEEENRLANPSADATGAATAFRFDNTREDKILSADTGVRFEFRTGPIDHRLIVSASTVRLDSKNAFSFSSFFAPFSTNLNNPIDVSPPASDFFVGGDLSDPLRTEATRNWSVAFADTMSVLEGRILATVGVRRQSIETRTFDFNSGDELSDYQDDALTPIGGLVFRPNDSISVYANYAQSLQPGDIAPAVSGGTPIANAGEVLDPFRGEQVELGVKFDRETFGGSLSVFRLSRQNPIVENNRFTSSGEQENQGFEASFFGEPFEGVRILGGATFLDSELARTEGGVDEGNTPIGVPDLQANVNVEWDVPALPGLTLDGRAIHTSEQFIDTANSQQIPSWTRFDLGARYAFALTGRDVIVRARLENVANADYWASAGGFPGANYLVLGAPRTFILSASIDL